MSLPHARGGVSKNIRLIRLPDMSSPRPWGCFLDWIDVTFSARVFPTPVGVFPTYAGAVAFSCGLPHARGGVSIRQARKYLVFVSSPRPWGCFCCWYSLSSSCGVFPTPVGVFPAHPHSTKTHARLPHARGGVSQLANNSLIRPESSPRPWGCF